MKRLLIAIILIHALLPAGAVAATDGEQTGGEIYVVRDGDSLEEIARVYYQDSQAFGQIVEATNLRALVDATMPPIANPNLILVGQPLWIPQSEPINAMKVPTSPAAGIYKAFLPSSTSMGRDLTLVLQADNRAQWTTDTGNTGVRMVERGKWTLRDDDTVLVEIVGRDGVRYNPSIEYRFLLWNGSLQLIDEGKSPFGAAGLTFSPIGELSSSEKWFDVDAAQISMQNNNLSGGYKAFVRKDTDTWLDLTLWLASTGQFQLTENEFGSSQIQTESGTWTRSGEAIELVVELEGEIQTTSLEREQAGLVVRADSSARLIVDETTFYPLAGFIEPTLTIARIMDAARNTEYAGIYAEAITLTDGLYEGKPFELGGASRPTVRLAGELSAIGDLDGDGDKDVAAVLSENSGGSGNFRYLAAVLFEAGEPVRSVTVFMSDRDRIYPLRIENEGEIRATILSHGVDDPLCCPSVETEFTYRLQDDRLTEASAFDSD